jgi:hypothetical protein
MATKAQAPAQTPAPAFTMFQTKKADYIKIDAAFAAENGFVEGASMVGTLKSYIPTKNDGGFMLEVVFGGTHSVLTYAKTSVAKLTTMLGGKIEMTYRGNEGVYANFSPKFLASFKED